MVPGGAAGGGDREVRVFPRSAWLDRTDLRLGQKRVAAPDPRRAGRDWARCGEARRSLADPKEFASINGKMQPLHDCGDVCGTPLQLLATISLAYSSSIKPAAMPDEPDTGLPNVKDHDHRRSRLCSRHHHAGLCGGPRQTRGWSIGPFWRTQGHQRWRIRWSFQARDPESRGRKAAAEPRAGRANELLQQFEADRAREPLASNGAAI